MSQQQMTLTVYQLDRGPLVLTGDHDDLEVEVTDAGDLVVDDGLERRVWAHGTWRTAQLLKAAPPPPA